MTSTTSISVFCQWLMSDSAKRLKAYTITLHAPETKTTDKLIADISDYLNEYDEDGDGLWLCATSELIAKAGSDPSNRRLLGLNDLDPTEHADTPEQFIQTLTALCSKGPLVCRWPDETWTPPTPGRTFHAGIGNPKTVHDRCHIILDPDLLPTSSFAHIIGDVFLDWMMSKSGNQKSLQSLR